MNIAEVFEQVLGQENDLDRKRLVLFTLPGPSTVSSTRAQEHVLGIIFR